MWLFLAARCRAVFPSKSGFPSWPLEKETVDEVIIIMASKTLIISNFKNYLKDSLGCNDMLLEKLESFGSFITAPNSSRKGKEIFKKSSI